MNVMSGLSGIISILLSFESQLKTVVMSLLCSCKKRHAYQPAPIKKKFGACLFDLHMASLTGNSFFFKFKDFLPAAEAEISYLVREKTVLDVFEKVSEDLKLKKRNKQLNHG